jgi:hypothetical protein
MDQRILVPGKTDVANLAGFLRLQQSLDWPLDGKETVGIFEADIFVILDQIDVVCLEAL